MSAERERLRKSITATLAEIEVAHHALGVGPDWREMAEATESVRRIETRLAASTMSTEPREDCQ